MTIYPMTREQKLQNVEAMLAWANGEPVQYWSGCAWTDCLDVDCEFPHRPKPPEEKPPVSTDINDY